MTEPSPHNGNAGDLLILDREAINALVDVQDLIAIAASALRKTSNGGARQDVRRVLDLPDTGGGCLSLMYAAIDDRPAFGAKVLSVLPGNFAHGLPSHRGCILLMEREFGRPIAVLDGGEVTAWRTAAASAVATQALSRSDSTVLALLGYGEQAQRHIETIANVRPIRTIRVWGRDPAKAEAFAQRQRAAGFEAQAYRHAEPCVAGADIVCTVTSARTPVLSGRWLSPGCHVNAVGASVPSCQEIDLDCLRRAGVWVDYMPMALTAASEIIQAKAERPAVDSLRGEIGAVLNGDLAGRAATDEITLYRSLGVPAQDIELANVLYAAARAAGRGAIVPFGG